ncbi:hypothetical protein NIBR502772_06000 [Pseudarthrobacter sp. NIBRBAC000502772]|uniref:hypothetical protein n=1 Tax=Pseudarthrobacter sp. NIBRBAC000502772 TaxID=2590775 RepID=UPI001132556E|nr:hypothetical protein [Pseudarthrobacter sp. NIBRBAC000502772]QDG65827.1 hypothetical protein NIBR502772_06000 [Pseudarthrobacter sp. NIBRBAC000502772]
MARIRTIKPDFWTDGNMVKLSPFARLLYIGMWNFTLCDHGHVADDAMKLKLQILPMDNVDIDALLAEIMNQGRVVRVEDGDGRTYLLVKRFEDHQKIDPRWKTRCPACAQVDSLTLTETPVSLGELTVTPELSPDLTLGREGMGRDGKKNLPSKPAASTDFDTFWAQYPRKVGKIAGKKAFDKAIRLTSLEQLLSGVELLKRETAGKELEFIPHPASWLTAGRWDDEPSTKPAASSPWSKDFHK